MPIDVPVQVMDINATANAFWTLPNQVRPPTRLWELEKNEILLCSGAEPQKILRKQKKSPSSQPERGQGIPIQNLK